jgi:hypothetical protein
MRVRLAHILELLEKSVLLARGTEAIFGDNVEVSVRRTPFSVTLSKTRPDLRSGRDTAEPYATAGAWKGSAQCSAVSVLLTIRPAS